MVTTPVKLTFEQFLEQYPEDGRYELVDGKIVKVEPTGAHKNVSRFLLFAFNDEVRRLGLDYVVDKEIAIRVVTASGQEQGRKPDVSVIDGKIWDKYLNTYVGIREPIQLAVEVTSTNWEDDYIDKMDEYQRLGISEYWIVDYLAIASRTYLGKPKVPTVFVYQLVDGQYQVQAFRGDERIVSKTFPELELTVNQILAASLPKIR
ncbi:MAG: Uma2 family endonuclease [Xenococcaceae cyanobacterium]